jgi:hypothetical protein
MAGCVTVILSHLALERSVLSPAEGRRALAASDVYKKLRDDTLTGRLMTSVLTHYPDNKLIDKDSIRQALAATVPDAQLPSLAEPAVTNIYRWLDSKEPGISFTIKIGDKRDAFLSALNSQLNKRIKALPECSAYDFAAQDELLSATCLSSYTTAKDAAAAVVKEINTSANDIGGDITSTSLGLDDLPSGVRNAPDYLNYFWVANLLAMAVGGILAILVIITRRLWGIVAVGISIVIGGCVTWMLAIPLSTLPTTNNIVSSVIAALRPHLTTLLTRYGALAVLGGVLIILLGVAGLRWHQRRR